jgi:hypothetical protein
VKQAVHEADAVATSLLAYTEARTAFARSRREGKFTPQVYRRIVGAFEKDWNRYVAVEITDELVKAAFYWRKVERFLATMRCILHRLSVYKSESLWKNLLWRLIDSLPLQRTLKGFLVKRKSRFHLLRNILSSSSLMA